jgi:hypothetical protein
MNGIYQADPALYVTLAAMDISQLQLIIMKERISELEEKLKAK